ncbi:MAG: TolC family protein, partial [Vulcanimicrobiaceae bacterium]
LGGEAARIAQLQYQNGLIALSDVLLAQQTSHQAHVDLINARTAYVNAVVQLRVALGTYGPRSAVADLTGRGKTSAAISNQPVPPKTSPLFGHNATALLPHHSSFRRNIRPRSGHRGFSRNLLEGTP